jgi:hypothetical protein
VSLDRFFNLPCPSGLNDLISAKIAEMPENNSIVSRGKANEMAPTCSIRLLCTGALHQISIIMKQVKNTLTDNKVIAT